MQKADQLRAWLTASIPQLKADASRFQVFLDKGTIRATGTPSTAGVVAFERAYTLTLQLLDFTGDDDAVWIALLAWLARFEPALLQNYDRNRQGISFEADLLDAGKMDLEIKIELTERVGATPRPDGTGYDIATWAEPPQAGLEIWPEMTSAPPPATEIWAGGEPIAVLPSDVP